MAFPAVPRSVLALAGHGQRWRGWAVLILLAAVATLANPYSLDEGDACDAANGERGECTRVSRCLPALTAIRRVGRSTERRCGFMGREEVVCCPPQRDFNPLSAIGGVGRRPHFIGGKRPTQSLCPISTSPTSTTTISTFVFDGGKRELTTRSPGRITTSRSVDSNRPGKRSSGKAREACQRYRSIEEPRIGWFILGGEEVFEGEFPHMAALGYIRQGQKKISWRCGGSLISEYFVVTAAHCLTDKYAGVPKLVRVGEIDLRPEAGGSGDYRVERWMLHPRYKRKFNYDDVGLLRLAAPVAFTQNVGPACLPLPASPMPRPPPQQGALIATGWGATESLGTAPSPLLLRTNLTEVRLEACKTLHRSSARIPEGITDDMLCAGDPIGLADTCVGDSGGPLQILEDSRSSVHTIVGITSFGPDPCGGKKPGVYVRVSNYVPWIESVVWE